MKCLIVVDMQNDFVYGSLGTEEARAIVPRVEAKILQYLGMEQGRIIFTRDTHWGNYLETLEGKMLPVLHCQSGSHGWYVIPELDGYRTKYADCTINKDIFGYDSWTGIFANGRNIESIELVGVCTDICVVTNALILKSLYPEIPIIVDASCCAGTTPENHQAALQVMRSCQIEVVN